MKAKLFILKINKGVIRGRVFFLPSNKPEKMKAQQKLTGQNAMTTHKKNHTIYCSIGRWWGKR